MDIAYDPSLQTIGNGTEDAFFYGVAAKGGLPGAVVAGVYGSLQAFYPGGANQAFVDGMAWQGKHTPQQPDGAPFNPYMNSPGF